MHTGNVATSNRCFHLAFRLTPLLCKYVWGLLGTVADPSIVNSVCPKHLLWALLFLKQYNSTKTNAALAGVDEKTFCKWSWIFAKYISKLNVVSTVFILSGSYISTFIYSH